MPPTTFASSGSVSQLFREVVFGIMPFLTLSNSDVEFAERELTWRTYTAAEALLTTKKVQIIDRKEFATAALDPSKGAFVVHVATLTSKIESLNP